VRLGRSQAHCSRLSPGDDSISALDHVSAQAAPFGPQFKVDVGLDAPGSARAEQRLLVFRGGNAIELKKLNVNGTITGKVSID
jgi:hypothetical protein